MRFGVSLCKPVLLAVIVTVAPLLPAADTPGWRILAGPVEMRPVEPALVSGSFRVIAHPPGIDPLGARPQGGACLVANLVPFGIGRARCVTNADCNAADALDKEHDPRLAGYIGYCMRRDGSDAPPQCWTRPGPAGTHCKRSVGEWQLSEGAHPLGPVAADPLGKGEPYPEWAVYACMAHPGHDRACGETVSPYRQVSLTPAPPAAE
jgi:hypothetical protein